MTGTNRADLVLHSGALFISGPTPLGFSVALGGGKILYAGPDQGLKPFIAPGTEVIDLRGRLVLPGFHDSHAHPLIGGLDLAGCSLLGLSSADAYAHAVQEHAGRLGNSACIRGSGWLYSCFAPCGPDKALLDAAVPGSPVYLKAIDGHTAWVNSRALELAGITAGTPDPAGGRIERDPATGAPTGTLRELSAMHLVEDRLPPYAPGDYINAAHLFLQQAAQLGITSVYDAMALPEYLTAYKALDDEGKLSLHVHCALPCDPAQGPEQATRLMALRKKYAGKKLHVPAAKFFLDGVVEGHTALLLEPYADRPDYSGENIWNEKALRKTTAALDRSGLQLHFHAVGDGAVRMALDSIGHALQANGRRDARHQISHCDLIADSDLPRFAALGVVANMQPAWFYKDKNFEAGTLPFLGRSRAHRLYRMNSLLDTGAIITCGSDWPVGGEIITLNPLDAIQIGLSRLALHESGGEAYAASEAVNLWSMLDFYTGQAAWACFQERLTGSLEAGKSADLIVLDRNIFDLPVHEIHTARVVLTLAEGRRVFRDSSL